MLCCTSFLFATIPIHAYHRYDGSIRMACYHHLFLGVAVLSVLFHWTHHPMARVADKLCAHTAFAFVLLHDTRQALNCGAGWLLLFPTTVGGLWVAQGLRPKRAAVLHTALHVAGAVGIHCWLVYVE